MRDHLPDHPVIIAIRGRGRVTLPKAVREGLSLDEGDQLLVVQGRSTLELVPLELVPQGDMWTLTAGARRRFDAAEDDHSAGRSSVVDDPRSLRHALRGLRADGE